MNKDINTKARLLAMAYGLLSRQNHALFCFPCGVKCRLKYYGEETNEELIYMQINSNNGEINLVTRITDIDENVSSNLTELSSEEIERVLNAARAVLKEKEEKERDLNVYEFNSHFHRIVHIDVVAADEETARKLADEAESKLTTEDYVDGWNYDEALELVNVTDDCKELMCNSVKIW